jgi:phosphopantothenate synthetase
MVDTKSKDNVNTSTGSTEVTNVYDTATQNCIRILDELTKAQPQYTQSVSNLQSDYVAAAKNTIQNIGSVQRMFASNVNFPIVTPQYTDEFVKRSNEITDNIVRAFRINNQLTVNAINAAAENFRTVNRTIDSVTEFNSSAAKAWNSFVTTQQQQFPYKQ